MTNTQQKISNIERSYQERAFSLLAAVLWLGNVSFKVIDNKNYVEVVADEAVTNVAMLMGCNSKELMVVLSTSKLQAGRDCIAKRLTLRQAHLAPGRKLPFQRYIKRSLEDDVKLVVGISFWVELRVEGNCN